MTRFRSAVVALVALAPALALVGPSTTAGASAPVGPVARGGGPATAYTVTGRIVRLSNGRPVRGVRVVAYGAIPDEGPLGSDLSNSEGRFVIPGAVATDNEFHLWVKGGRVGYERGWWSCDPDQPGDLVGGPYESHDLGCTHTAAFGKIEIKKS